MALKLLVDPETDAILGAQGVGDSGVDKRIDVIATAITGGLTASALAELELAYAPAFSSAKDPVNMLGHVADNLRRGTSASLPVARAGGCRGLRCRRRRRPRHAERTDAGVIPEAIHVPLNSLRERLDEIPAGPVVVHCAVGVRGHTAARILPSTVATCATSTAGCAPGGRHPLAGGRGPRTRSWPAPELPRAAREATRTPGRRRPGGRS